MNHFDVKFISNVLESPGEEWKENENNLYEMLWTDSHIDRASLKKESNATLMNKEHYLVTL